MKPLIPSMIYSLDFIGIHKIVFRVEAIISAIVTVEEMQSSPISPIKVSETTLRKRYSSWRESIKNKRSKTMDRFTYREVEDDVLTERKTYNEAKVKSVPELVGTMSNIIGFLISYSSRSLRKLNNSAFLLDQYEIIPTTNCCIHRNPVNRVPYTSLYPIVPYTSPLMINVIFLQI